MGSTMQRFNGLSLDREKKHRLKEFITRVIKLVKVADLRHGMSEFPRLHKDVKNYG